MSRTSPYKAWVVQRSGKPKEVEITRGPVFGHEDWECASTGTWYRALNLHPTKDAAIEAGLAALDAQQARLTKQQTTLDKKRATLIAAREKA